MTTITRFAGRLRYFPHPTKDDASGVGLRQTLPASFACKIKDHLSCLADFCRCACHEDRT